MSSSSSVVLTDVPIVDLSKPRSEVVAQVRRACSSWGFFQVINHNVDEAQIREFEDLCVEFFNHTDLSAKEACRRNDANFRGWFNNELTKQTLDWKEGFDVGTPRNPRTQVSGLEMLNQPNQWPSSPSNFQAVVEAYFETMACLSREILHLMASGLGLGATALDSEFEDHTSFLRLNKYPVCEKPVDEHWDSQEPTEEHGFLGINKHTDSGALTILFQRPGDPSSLQVLNRQTQKWHTVQPTPGSFTINTGDMMQVWSNDQYVAPLHRVLANRERVRFSFPFFYNPSYDCDVAPVQGSGNPRYDPIKWGVFRRRRVEGDFADYGTEVQITDWKRTPQASL